MSALVEARDLRFHYGEGDFELSIPELVIGRGESVACTGPSGTGKTTLVQLLTGVLAADSGSVILDGEALAGLGEEARRERRIRSVGMVFQDFALLEYLSALDNILLPYHLARELVLDRVVRERARELARETGIERLLGRKPARLSQGERQRVALCRALVTEPALVIADEPTGNLDPKTARAAVDLLFRQTRARDATLLVVTHDHSLLERFDRVIDMEQLADDGAPAASLPLTSLPLTSLP